MIPMSTSGTGENGVADGPERERASSEHSTRGDDDGDGFDRYQYHDTQTAISSLYDFLILFHTLTPSSHAAPSRASAEQPKAY